MTARASQIIPKEHFPTYQRWEMDTLEQNISTAARPADTKSRHRQGDAEPAQAQVVLPTVEEIEKIHQEAQQEGYAAGYETGQEAGMKAGYETGKELAASEAARMEAAFRSLQEALADADQKICGDLLTLALGLAREMVREALRVKPELVLAVVRECIRQEPVFGQPLQLFLHPDDAVLVRGHLNQEINNCDIYIDQGLERGGCRIRMGSSEIDATLGTRWRRVAQALGQSADWLE